MKKVIFVLLYIHFSLLMANAQWFTQQSGTTNPLYDIEFINRKTGWSCGDGGYIIKTTNGGENWIQQGAGVTFEPLFGIDPVDSNVVYAVGFYRTVVKTTNGGTTWIKIESGFPGDGRYTCVLFTNESKGWIGNFGPGYGIRMTTDGGQTISSVPFNGYPEDLFFKDSLNGVGVGGLSYIYRTTNGGINWSSYSIVQNGDLYRVSFINGTTGFTASRRAAYKTTNFGASWDSVGHIPVTFGSVMSIAFCNVNTGWAGTQYQLYKTTNGGGIWVIQNSTLSGVVYSLSAYNDSLVWGCGNGGRIWHTVRGGDTLSFINQISNSIQDGFELYQNYPNPFNSTTRIPFSITKPGKYKMDVINNLGQRVNDLFDNEILEGSYEVSYNADKLTTGIYFYRLIGEEVIVKKFLLLK